MVYFGALRPADEHIPERLFIDREADRSWLSNEIEAYFEVLDENAQRKLLVQGGKGTGKTVLVRTVLQELRTRYADRVVFLELNCRELTDARSVLRKLTFELGQALGTFASKNKRGIEPLQSANQVLVAMCASQKLTVSEVAELTSTLKIQVGLPGALTELLKIVSHGWVDLSGSAGFDRTNKQSNTTSRELLVDDRTLFESARVLLRAIRETSLRVVLWLDNVDELSHDYASDTQRQQAAGQAKLLLSLANAPIALIASMRTYFSGIAREFEARTVRPLDSARLMQMLEARLKEEVKPEASEILKEPRALEMAHQLSKILPTPLTFLDAFKTLCQQEAYGLGIDDSAVRDWIESKFATLTWTRIRRIVAAFPQPEATIDRNVLLTACDGREGQLQLVQDRQLVLPLDFWSPEEFILDPSLYFLHPGRRA